MSYEKNPGLARVLTKAFREQGLKTRRALNESQFKVQTPDYDRFGPSYHGGSYNGAMCILECKKNDTEGEDVFLWAADRDNPEEVAFRQSIRKYLVKAGLRVNR